MIINNKKNNLPFKRNLSVALISSCLLFACGGGSDSSSGSSTSLSGTASKGIILGGAVTAYLIDSDASDGKGDEVGTAITNATDGTYELTLADTYNGEALIIEITAADGSQMKCDLSVCKAADGAEPAIIFGDLYTLPSDFELSAVASGTDSDTISINITPLTNIAAALTLDKVSEGAAPADAATLSNFEVAQTLGLGSDVTALPIVDLTDADAINAADSDALEANLKSAAVVEAALSGSADGTSLEDAIDSFVTQYVDSNGVAETEGTGVDTASVSLEEIAAASQELATTLITELDGVSAEDENIAAVEVTLDAEETAAAGGTTDIIVVDIPDTLGSEGLAATKQFVSQLRNFTVATQLDGDELSDEQNALNDVNAFKDEISLVSDLVSSDFDVSAEALSLAAAAIAEAVDAALDSETPLTTHTYVSESGNITVAISVSGDTVTYTVDQTLTVANSIGVATIATIDLTAVLEFSDTIEDSETETGPDIVNTDELYSETYTWSVDGTASVDLALSGSVSTEQVIITIDDGSHFIATLTVDEEELDEDLYTYTPGEEQDTWTEHESETASGLLSVTGVDIELSVIIAQVAGGDITDPISFTGDLDIAATLFSVDYDETELYEYDETESNITDSYEYSESQTNSETEIVSIDGFTASLSGTFSNSENSLAATVAIAASGIEETCTWSNEWSYTSSNGSDNSHSESDDCSLTGETAGTFGSASISVMLSLDIEGIDDNVELDALIQRTGLESGIASIDLSYGGNLLDFDFDTDNIVEEGDTTITTTITATLTNHNGVVLTVTDVETDYETGSDSSDTFVTTGRISHAGEEFATVTDEGLVTFSDGTFVTAW